MTVIIQLHGKIKEKRQKTKSIYRNKLQRTDNHRASTLYGQEDGADKLVEKITLAQIEGKYKIKEGK